MNHIMEPLKFIATSFEQYISETRTASSTNWFHGTPDGREVDKNGRFNTTKITVDYVKDPVEFNDLQDQLSKTRESNDMVAYHALLDTVSDYKSNFEYNKPLFLSDNYTVAKTYADPRRAFDYQNSLEKVYDVVADCSNIVQISAPGERFRFIGIHNVRNGFINAGVTPDEIDRLISMFNYYVKDNKGIKTDVIAAIGCWLKFDCIDVIGVLDSHNGGNIRSTVRMLLNPSEAKII